VVFENPEEEIVNWVLLASKDNVFVDNFKEYEA